MWRGGGGQTHDIGGCRMRASIMGAMVVSCRLQCQGPLDFVHLCHYICCKPMMLPWGISLLSHTVLTAAYTDLPEPELDSLCSLSFML